MSPPASSGSRALILPVIMAGGAGTRLWPLSSATRPKQFQVLAGKLSTFAAALLRVKDPAVFLPPVVITAQGFAGIAAREARRAGVAATFILEPTRCDSAAAVAVAACHAATISPDTPVLVVAADHQITDDMGFTDAVREGLPLTDDAIVVFGVTPAEASAAYGYIRRVKGSTRVAAFIEKPAHDRARRLIEEGCLWNAGNFLFRAGHMIDELEKFAPDVLGPVRRALGGARETGDGLLLDAAAFGEARRTSIDFAVMEKTQSVHVIEGRFGWSDIGSFEAVHAALPHDGDGNAVTGDGHTVKASGTLIHAGPGTRVIAAGVKDLVIASHGGTVLVAPRGATVDMRKIAERFAEPETAAFPKPIAALEPASLALETVPLVASSGFREYDARWWIGEGRPELNLLGAEALGLGLGTLLARRGQRHVVTGHDYRSYSQAIKLALSRGLMAAGMTVHDIGLAITPMAYFAQFELGADAVAMVTASHNENGWTGVKMGAERPVTFGPEDMAELKAIVLSGDFEQQPGGAIRHVPDMRARYVASLTARGPFTRRFRAVVATGNGTAGAFAPEVLAKLGIDVIPLHTNLDFNFPNYNPNPEDMKMLADIARVVKAEGADIGFGFDGDGDRCGIVDNEGQEIFADKVGLLLARDLAARHAGSRFVVDVKSTCLYASDAVLRSHGATTDYFKTGHSHIKRRIQELQALAGFEKSGHFFFNEPLGRGYDDGLVTAIAILDMLDRAPGKSIAELYRELPRTWGSPTMSAQCADDLKYDVVARLAARIAALSEIGGAPIIARTTVNGIRVTTADGTWGLVRASSNKPELVVVVESPVSEARQRQMFASLDGLLRESPDVGAYNQTF